MPAHNRREAMREVSLDVREGADLLLVRAVADKGLVDFERLMTELLVSMRSAGADLIISHDTRRRAGLKTMAPR